MARFSQTIFALAALFIVSGAVAFLDPSHNFFIENSAVANASIIIPQAEAMFLSDGSMNPDYFSFSASASAGDTASSLVDCAEPAAFWIFGSALGFLGWTRHRKTASAITAKLYEEPASSGFLFTSQRSASGPADDATSLRPAKRRLVNRNRSTTASLIELSTE